MTTSVRITAPARVARLLPALLAASVVACTAGEEAPSPGTYTIEFPSTAAAVATDTVRLLVFEAPPEAERDGFCATLIRARKRRDQLRPLSSNQPVNICEMLFGRKPVTIGYGDKAVLAIAQRKGEDFMIGCNIQTVGDGDLPLPITMSLFDVGTPVPDTQCVSVGEFCAARCQ